MGCCSSNLKLDLQRTFDASSRNSSICSSSKRSRSGSNSFATNSSGLGSACSTPQRNRSIWSRSQTRPICDDFAERPMEQTNDLDKSCGYHTCSSAASTPSKRELRRTQDMEQNQTNLEPAVSNLEWEMFMMQHAQRLMSKTSSPICQRRRDATIDLNSRSYHKWRNYLQSTPAHMLHNVSHIPEAIAGHFCPTDFPAFSDLEEMESAAKRFKVDTEATQTSLQSNYQMRKHLTHTISTDL